MTLQKIRTRRGTAAQWSGINPVLGLGEKGIETDTLFEKVGDGATAWNGLPYLDSGSFILRSTFVARVAGGWSPEVGFEVSAAGLAYVYTGAGTNISDLPGWVPAGEMSLYHWGVTGWENDNARFLLRKLAADAGVVDDTARINAALSYAATSGRHLSGDPKQVFGVSGPLFYGSATNSPRAAKDQGKISHMNFCVIGGDWSDVDGEIVNVLMIGNLVIGGPAKFSINSERIFVDGNNIAKSGILYHGVANSLHLKNEVLHCTLRQQQIGNALVRGDNRSGDCTDSKFIGLGGGQWVFNDAEAADPANYTAAGLVVRGADSTIAEANFRYANPCLHVAECSQVQFEGGHFWNGDDIETLAVSEAARVEEAIQVSFNGTRFDQGKLRIVGNRNARPLNVSVVGCRFFGYIGFPAVVLETSYVGQSIRNFVFVGNQTGDNNLAYRAGSLVTTGAGTFVDPLDCIWSANSGVNGAPMRLGAFTEILGNGGAVTKRSGAMGAPSFHADNSLLVGYNRGAVETDDPEDAETGQKNHGGLISWNAGAGRFQLVPSTADGPGWSFDYTNRLHIDRTDNLWTFDKNLKANAAILSAAAPASAAATGTTGEIRVDANYIYVCTATNTWKRSALTSW